MAKKPAAKEKNVTKPAVRNVDVQGNVANVEIKPAESTAKTKPYVAYADSKEAKKEIPAAPEKPVVSTRAQLRDAAQAQGTTVSTEQVAQAKAAEEKTAEEGAKKERLPMSATPRK